MSTSEESFVTACKDRIIPGAVLIAADKSGTLEYKRAFGVRSLDSAEPLRVDDIMHIASCTKLMTCIAVMQCVERGLIGLEDDVSVALPELADLQVLTGFDEKGAPVLKKREKVFKLRHLLTHSSGLVYDAYELLERYRRYRNEPLGTMAGKSIRDRYMHPALFEPDTSWSYGTGIDWAGKLVANLTKQSLEQYLRANVWDPLGIKDITFFPGQRADFEGRLVGMSSRDPQGSGKVVAYHGPGLVDDVEEELGGVGAFGSMKDYFEILRSLLLDDEKLLKKKTAAMMFQPHLSKESREAMGALHVTEWWDSIPGVFPKTQALDWGLGGVLVAEEAHSLSLWRRKGTMIWGGFANLFWSIDRGAGLCMLYGGQVIPPGDKPTKVMIEMFEKAMYGRAVAHAFKE